MEKFVSKSTTSVHSQSGQEFWDNRLHHRRVALNWMLVSEKIIIKNPSGQTREITVPDGWTAGRIWARRDCDEKFNCHTGFCGVSKGFQV